MPTARRLLLSLSAVFCAVTIALWIRSHFVADHLAYNTADPTTGKCRAYRLIADRGLVQFDFTLRVFDEIEGLDVFVHDLPIFLKESIG